MIPDKRITKHLKASDFKDVQYMSAAEKLKVAKNWETFLRARCAAKNPSEMLRAWTRALYNHFYLHLGHIAHYDIHGFYQAQWASWDTFVENVIKLAGDRDHMGSPLARGAWGANVDYEDLGHWIVEVAKEYLDDVRAKAQQERKDLADRRLAHAQAEHDAAYS